MTIEERLEKLEIELARMTAGIASREDVVNAKKFNLLDDNGKTRASLSATELGTALTLRDENNQPRASLSVTELETALTLRDENNQPRAKLALSKNGPELALCDENDKPRARLAVSKDEMVLDLFDADGKPLVGLFLSKDGSGSGLLLRDKNHFRVMLSVSELGTDLTLYDTNGKRIWQSRRWSLWDF